jgi:hypothetical protein
MGYIIVSIKDIESLGRVICEGLLEACGPLPGHPSRLFTSLVQVNAGVEMCIHADHCRTTTNYYTNNQHLQHSHGSPTACQTLLYILLIPTFASRCVRRFAQPCHPPCRRTVKSWRRSVRDTGCQLLEQPLILLSRTWIVWHHQKGQGQEDGEDYVPERDKL